LLADVRAHELIIVGMIAIAAIALTRVESRFGALACLGVVGYGMALLYVFYGAPDLAKTQIIVESLSVVLFALLAAAMPGFKSLAPVSVRRRDAALAAIAGILMGLLVYFTLTTGQDRSVSDFYRENSLPLAHGRNVVNVILVDFRALDTLGEITVLAVAAFGAQALMRRRRRARKAPS
jgi:multicomponent Na+:H+ antiporter subunit A